MPEVELSSHAQDMLAERGIAEEWLWRTIHTPDRAELGPDGNTHFTEAIAEHGGCFLRVIPNRHVAPEPVVTVSSARTLRRWNGSWAALSRGHRKGE